MENRDRIGRLREVATSPSRNRSVSLGLLLLCLGLLALVFAPAATQTSLGNNADPGPRIFPFILSGILIIGGALEIALAVREGINDRFRFTFNKRFAATTLLLFAFLPAIYWGGFFLATFVIATAIGMILGTRHWVAVLTATVLLAVIKVMFGILFKLPLPEGPLGF